MAILSTDPERPNDPLDRVLEDSLDIWFQEQMQRWEGAPDEVYNSYHAILSEHCQQASRIAQRALEALRIHDWETVIGPEDEPMVEWHFEREVPGIGLLTGDVDWVARHRPTGLVWLFDHKIRKTLTNALAEDYNIQMALYQHILQEDYGIEIAGSITNQVSSKMPGTPKLNKGGLTMSRAAIDTDWATYERCLIEADLDPADYEDIQAKLASKRYFDLTRYFRSRTHTRNIWENIFLPAATRMRNALYTSAADPGINIRSMNSFRCRRCPYSPVCLAELRDHDTDYIVRTQFRRRDTSALSMDDTGRYVTDTVTSDLDTGD
jgi:hypothetical protein